MIVLDTNVVSEMMRIRPNGAVESWLSHLWPAETALSVISLHELRYGITRLGTSAEQLRLLRMLDRILTGAVGSILVLDAKASETAAWMRVDRMRIGREMSLPDAFIAGIAARHGAALATRNTRDFEGLDLPLINPWKSSNS